MSHFGYKPLNRKTLQLIQKNDENPNDFFGNNFSHMIQERTTMPYKEVLTADDGYQGDGCHGNGCYGGYHGDFLLPRRPLAA